MPWVRIRLLAGEAALVALERALRQQALVEENHSMRMQLDDRFGIDTCLETMPDPPPTTGWAGGDAHCSYSREGKVLAVEVAAMAPPDTLAGAASGTESITIAANLRDNGNTEISFRSAIWTDPEFLYIDNIQIEKKQDVLRSVGKAEDAAEAEDKNTYIDEEFAKSLDATRAKLTPPRLNADGRIMEWLREYPEADPHHRQLGGRREAGPGGVVDPHHGSVTRPPVGLGR